MNIQDRIVTLLSEIGQGLYEKEAELRLGLLAALAGESIILLGPPHTEQKTLPSKSSPNF